MADNPVRIDTLVLSGSLLTVQDQVIFVNGSPVGTGNFALDINLVKTTGDQGISGYKTISSVNITSGIFIAPNNFSTVNRTLSSSTGTVYDYQNGLFYNTGSLNTIDVYNRLLKSGNSILTLAPSLDWNKKELYGEWIIQQPVNSSGIVNKAYVDGRVSIGGVTGLSLSGSPYITGGFVFSGVGGTQLILSGQTILFSGGGSIISSSDITVTGSTAITNPNFTGTAGINVVLSGAHIIISGTNDTDVSSLGAFEQSSLVGSVILSGAGNTQLTTLGNTIIISGALSTGTGTIVHWDDVISKPTTFPQTRATVSGNTISLPANALDSGFSLSLGKSSLIHRIETNIPAWIRLYGATGYRSGDYSRLVTIDPTGEHGLMLEVVTTASNNVIDLAPPILCYNTDSVNSIYGTIKNLSAGTTTIGVAITRLLLEE